MVYDFKGIDTELELAEALAHELGLHECEQDLSDDFDEHIAPLVIEQYGEDDEPAMNEAFSDYKDGLTKDGKLHAIQCHEYGYVGKYA